MKKLLTPFIFLICFLPFLGAQADPIVILEYYDDDFEVEIYPPGESDMLTDLYFGMEIPVGSTINTYDSTVELSLDPNGSIIKISKDTTFVIDALQGKNSQSNDFALLTGKFRAIASSAVKGTQYTVRGQTTVCGVRGTDFGMDLDTGINKEEAFVLKGEIDYSRKKADGSLETIRLGKGHKANAFDDNFMPIEIPLDELTKLMDSFDFKKLADKAALLNAEKESGGTEQPEGGESEGGAEGESEPITTEAPISSDEIEAGGTTGGEETPVEPELPNPMDPIMDYLRKVLGFEVGSVTIEGKTYSKAILQPTFNLGKLGLSLYLPIIYENDLFDPDNWYHPAGNDEWSFGTDAAFANEDPVIEWTARGLDFLSDLALKIRYLKYGNQRDPFFINLGNLDDMTLGHGILIKDYNNNIEFPSVRKVGVGLGMDFGYFGFEALTADIAALADSALFGLRVYFRPAKKGLAFGISAASDLHPARQMENAEAYGDPIFVNVGLDIDLPIVTSDFFSLVIFADGAGMIPYLRTEITGSSETVTGKRFAPETIYNPTTQQVKNFGVKAGLMGNIAFVDWVLEYRYYTGTFIPEFYGPTYDRMKTKYVVDNANYLLNIDSYDSSDYIMGIYADSAFEIKDLLDFKLAYLWPWELTEDNSIITSDYDYFEIDLGLKPDAIKGFPVYGSVFYKRTSFIPTLLSNFSVEGFESFENFSLFDENTVLGGEIVYQVTPNFSLIGGITTVLATDENGNLILDENGKPRIVPSISFDTRFSF